MPQPFTELRSFVRTLERSGDIARVQREVDADYEIGAILRHAATLGSPAPLFERVRGVSTPLVGNLFGTRRRIAAALGTDVSSVVRTWAERSRQAIDPILVEHGPCQENVLLGDDIDLSRLPAPIFNDKDPGPFITAGCHISQHPRTGERNVGIYRNQIHGPRLLGVLVAPYRHLMQHRAAADTSKPFPLAIVVGAPPAVFLAAGADYPFGTDELAKAGALQDQPVELVSCETVPLHVPANSELIIEGELLPDELREEGPFGEFTGYYGTAAPRPVIHVTALTFRNDFIYQAGYTGRPPNENVAAMAVAREASILADVSLPGLRAIHALDGGCGYFIAVASIEKPFEGYGKMMAMAILGTWGARAIKVLVMVDSDVDPYNLADVQWAIATRMQPDRDVDVIKQLTGVALDPSIPLQDRLSGAARTSKMVIDATRFDAAAYELEVLPRASVYEQVVNQWDTYGIPRGGPPT